MHIYGAVFIYCQLFYWVTADSPPSVKPCGLSRSAGARIYENMGDLREFAMF